ncbi:MAG: hypothetical protein V9G20_30195 [Candidatus Promineifilaceae bacterium]
MIPAVITFSASGAELAMRIAAATGGRVHHCGSNGENAQALLPRLFHDGTPIVGICAAGILIRILAPHLADKHEEPPVLAVASDGKSVVPLLGGHHGANQLTRSIAETLGAHAALTTASDSKFARGLDEPPSGWELSEDCDAKPAMMSLLVGAKIAVDGHAPWIAEAGYPVSSMGAVKVLVTEQKLQVDRGLVYHPRTLVAGVGCERGADARRSDRAHRFCPAPRKPLAPVARRHRLDRHQGRRGWPCTRRRSTSTCRCACSRWPSSTRSATGSPIPPPSSRPKSARPASPRPPR